VEIIAKFHAGGEGVVHGDAPFFRFIKKCPQFVQGRMVLARSEHRADPAGSQDGHEAIQSFLR
jgi:hypothetical protein